MVVYVDLIFLTNLIIDGALIGLTAWMRQTKLVWWRWLLSAIVGALYVVMMFVPQFDFMFTFLIKFGFSLVMLSIAFGYKGLQAFTRTLGTFYVINFVAAGGILGVHYMLQSSGELFNGIWFTASGGMSFDLKIAFWFTFIVFFVVLLLFKIVQSAKRKTDRLSTYLGKVEVCIDEMVVSCTGLLDTGNQLTDPLSRMPVMVMEASLWQEWLPESWKHRLKQDSPDQLIMELDQEQEHFKWQDRLRLVPYRGINKGTAFMLAIKPDRVRVTMEETPYETTKVLIGLDGGVLSSDGKYQAVIHPELVQEAASAQSTAQSAEATEKPLNVV
ncbi:sigma-E processing peptidase SpoIIGA [Paenibacillus barcinonensis]|uniref:Sigma-E processing peptidase SpoIIGA n=1 Tax=Paenibacillus barcinonensis TaxID=198119 RepID=A0A2V4UZX3_PAEBA|nr:sigma-E processing peptidase SpoIIGA [Paenibacillus barcinonensis]PYE45737.1 stage II sporulation protein GA (sporulation sigma-E factor processing peptidase) [Paenibacillus barcinonensis]QKS56307.1 sigma-E processing peptidase SpoIIGA [Paenibacillus barcinonensis]